VNRIPIRYQNCASLRWNANSTGAKAFAAIMALREPKDCLNLSFVLEEITARLRKRSIVAHGDTFVPREPFNLVNAMFYPFVKEEV
jgi:hypothetical protein